MIFGEKFVQLTIMKNLKSRKLCIKYTDLESRIDQLIYQFYDLMPEEIAMVEVWLRWVYCSLFSNNDEPELAEVISFAKKMSNFKIIICIRMRIRVVILFIKNLITNAIILKH